MGAPREELANLHDVLRPDARGDEFAGLNGTRAAQVDENSPVAYERCIDLSHIGLVAAHQNEMTCVLGRTRSKGKAGPWKKLRSTRSQPG